MLPRLPVLLLLLPLLLLLLVLLLPSPGIRLFRPLLIDWLRVWLRAAPLRLAPLLELRPRPCFPLEDDRSLRGLAMVLFPFESSYLRCPP
jgi:hypothetical protein